MNHHLFVGFKYTFYILVLNILASCGGGEDSGSPRIGSGGLQGVALFWTIPLSSVDLKPGEVREYQVGGGVPPYIVSSTNPEVFTAVVDGNLVRLVGGNASGIGILDQIGALKLVDSGGSSLSATINLIVPLLYTDAGSFLTVAAGSMRSFSVGGGSKPYSVLVEDPQTVAASINQEGMLKIDGLKFGSSFVYVTDSVGRRETIIVDVVQSSQPDISLLPAALSVSSGRSERIIYNIGGKSPPYRGFSSDVSAAVVSVDGNILIVDVQNTCSTNDRSIILSVLDAEGRSATSEMTVAKADSCP